MSIPNAIAFNFVALPDEITDFVFNTHLTGNQLTVLLAIVKEILKFPSGRASLTRELSCRYLSKKINISFQAVSRAIKKLVELDLIEILAIGKKSIGSLIKLNLKCVTSSETHNEKCVTPERTNIISTFNNNNCCSTNNTVVGLSPSQKKLDMVSPKKSPREEKNKIQTQKPEDPPLFISPLKAKKKEEVFFTPQNSINTENNFISKKEYKELLLLAEEINLKPSLITNGIKTLTKRNCENIRTVMEDIIRQVRYRLHMIKNKGGYFNSLCQRIDFTEVEETGQEAETIIIDEPTIDYSNNGGFKPVPEWLLSDEPVNYQTERTIEPTEEEILQEKKRSFSNRISNWFRIGRVQFVLSPDGTKQKIIACTDETLSYVKEGVSLRHIAWKDLPEKLLREELFV